MSEITTSEGEKEEVCALCKCLAKHKCSACKSVFYCSREHQKSDWKIHSKNCQIFMLVENSTIGRHYIATRNIEMDEIIMREKKPLLFAPRLNTVPVCLNCYVPLTLENAKPCGNCGWPLCFDCTRHGPECQLTMKYRKSKVEIYGYSKLNPIYTSISLLRALALREKSPDDYKKLLNLQCHYTDMLLHAAHFLKMYLQINDLDEQEIARILGIVAVNGFRTKSRKNSHLVAVFDKASFNAHDCSPNCRWTSRYDANSGAEILIRAVRMIPKGQSITISYTNLLDGTTDRRKILRDSKFFDCTCKRCKDPTEFGTMLSAVKCFQKDCTGYMLPSTFLVSKDTQIPDYVCNKCELTTPSTTIDEIIKEVSTQFSRIETKNQKELKKFIENQSKILHHNHFHITNAQIKVAVQCNENELKLSSLPSEYLKEHITLFKKLAGILEVLAPINYEPRGMILSLEFSYMMALIPREILRNRHDCFILYKDCKKAFTEAYRLLRSVTGQDTIHELESMRPILESYSHRF